MKCIDALAKLTSRTNVLGICGGLLIAGAALAGAPAAQAQQFGFGFHIGTPRYVAPVPAYRPYVAPGYAAPAYVAPVPAEGYWDHRRWDDWHRHEEWTRSHEFYGRPVSRPY